MRIGDRVMYPVGIDGETYRVGTVFAHFASSDEYVVRDEHNRDITHCCPDQLIALPAPIAATREAALDTITAHHGYCTGVTEYDCLCGEPCGSRGKWDNHFISVCTEALNTVRDFGRWQD